MCMHRCVIDCSHFGSTLGDQCTQVGQEVCEASSTTDKSVISCLTRPGRTCLREKQPSGVHGSISHVGGRRILMPSETLLYHFGFELTSFVESNSAGAQSKGGESKPLSFHQDWWTHQVMMKTEQFCICSRFSSKWSWTKGRIQMNKAGWTLRRRDRCELWVNNIGHILFTHCIAYSVCGAFGHI